MPLGIIQAVTVVASTLFCGPSNHRDIVAVRVGHIDAVGVGVHCRNVLKP